MVLVVEPLLGTRAEIAVTSDLGDSAGLAERAIADEVARLEGVFTVYDDTSALHLFRRTGATDVSELQTVVDLAKDWQELTGGAFHPGAQSLVDLWDEAERSGVIPSPEQLGEVAARLHIPAQPADLNLNAIAKGWIAYSALHKVLAATPEVTAGWVSLGGDVAHAGQGSVVVGIEDPKRPYDNVAPLAKVTLSNEALATSGGARRWWTIGDRRFSKVLDPRTGWPTDHIASATVVAADGSTADALATVALVIDTDETLALAEEFGAQVLLIQKDGAVVSSSERFTQT